MSLFKIPSLFAWILVAAVVRPGVAAADWNAALDLKRNELLGAPQESMNPNPTVPEWSYGYRLESAIASTNLTLFDSPSEHINSAAGSPDLQGWYHPASGPTLAANTSENPVIVSFCASI
jgi:hypothetical protein